MISPADDQCLCRSDWVPRSLTIILLFVSMKSISFWALPSRLFHIHMFWCLKKMFTLFKWFRSICYFKFLRSRSKLSMIFESISILWFMKIFISPLITVGGLCYLVALDRFLWNVSISSMSAWLIGADPWKNWILNPLFNVILVWFFYSDPSNYLSFFTWRTFFKFDISAPIFFKVLAYQTHRFPFWIRGRVKPLILNPTVFNFVDAT